MVSGKKEKEDLKTTGNEPGNTGSGLFAIGTPIILVLVIIGVMLFNSFQMISISSAVDSLELAPAGSTSSGSTASASGSSGGFAMPSGVPPIYGSEIGVSFDDVTPANPAAADAAISKMAALDNSISLSGSDLQRYISIASQISCEYCCGAGSIITSSGTPACGCAHSYAMRGLAKYLITKHGSQYTDDQILEELAKWKALFFPSQTQQKAAALSSQGIPVNFINIGSNKYRGIEQGTSGGMVGGC